MESYELSCWCSGVVYRAGVLAVRVQNTVIILSSCLLPFVFFFAILFILKEPTWVRVKVLSCISNFFVKSAIVFVLYRVLFWRPDYVAKNSLTETILTLEMIKWKPSLRNAGNPAFLGHTVCLINDKENTVFPAFKQHGKYAPKYEVPRACPWPQPFSLKSITFPGLENAFSN